LADYAATLSQGQLRALKFRLDPRSKRVLWQEQVLGPVQDKLVILDGKEIRHADVESVSAVSGTGRWPGSTMVQERQQ
jgi:hypothetical protein